MLRGTHSQPRRELFCDRMMQLLLNQARGRQCKRSDSIRSQKNAPIADPAVLRDKLYRAAERWAGSDALIDKLVSVCSVCAACGTSHRGSSHGCGFVSFPRLHARSIRKLPAFLSSYPFFFSQDKRLTSRTGSGLTRLLLLCHDALVPEPRPGRLRLLHHRGLLRRRPGCALGAAAPGRRCHEQRGAEECAGVCYSITQ